MYKFIIYWSAVIVLFVVTISSSPAQITTRGGNVYHALTQVMGAQRADRLRTMRKFDKFTLLSDSISGYAVVVEEAEGTSVLAYGSSFFKDGQLPDELKDLFENLAQVAQTSHIGNRKASNRRKAASYNIVEPMIETHWTQQDPYNAYCPIVNNKRSITGCLPLALGQVLKYHAPKKTHGKRAYKYNNRIESFDYSQFQFNWSQMPSRITKNTPQAQKEQVGQLLYACGVLTNAMYGRPNGTPAYTVAVETSVNHIFDGLRCDTYWYTVDRVYEELDAKRPVLYIGTSPQETHCFVIDGYDSKGYMHCNLGWDRYDGYFNPYVMYGFNKDAFIITMSPCDNSYYDLPIDELQYKLATTKDVTPNTLETSKWYVLWNMDSSNSIKAEYNSNKHRTLAYASYPSGESTTRCAGQLVRFIAADNCQYYIQTGNGKYLHLDNGILSTVNELTKGYTTTFAFARQHDGSFTIQANGRYLKSSLGGQNIQSTDKLEDNTKSWKIYEIQLTNDPQAILTMGGRIILQSRVQSLIDRVTKHATGFPSLTAATGTCGWNVLVTANNNGFKGCNASIINDAYDNVAAITQVNLPVQNRHYHIRAIFQDGTLGYLAHNASGHLILTNKPSYTYTVDKITDKIVALRGESGFFLSVEASDKSSIQSSYISSYCDLRVSKQNPNIGNNYHNATPSLLLGCLTLQGINASSNEVFYLTANSLGGFNNGTPDQLYFDCTAQNGKYRSCQFRFEEVPIGKPKQKVVTDVSDDWMIPLGITEDGTCRDLQGRVVSPSKSSGIIIQGRKKILR